MAYNNKTKQYEGYIYLYDNIVTNMKYVGQTTRTIEIRHKQHIRGWKHKTPLHFDVCLHEEGVENFEIKEIKKYSCNSLDDLRKTLNQDEEYYIEYYNTLIPEYGGCGYNISIGGNNNNQACIPVNCYSIEGKLIKRFKSRIEAAEYFHSSPDTITMICDGRVGNLGCKYVFRNKGDSFEKYNYKTGKYKEIYVFTPNGDLVKTFYCRRDANKFIKADINSGINDPNSLVGGYWISTEPIFNYLGNTFYSAVDLYDLNGQYINSFYSASECARFIDATSDEVCNCCLGKRVTLRGKYITRYKGDDINKYPLSYTSRKIVSINQYTLDNKYVKTFTSIKEAMDECNTKSPGAIWGCCNHNYGRNTAYGYKWYFSDDESQPDKTKIYETRHFKRVSK